MWLCHTITRKDQNCDGLAPVLKFTYHSLEIIIGQLLEQIMEPEHGKYYIQGILEKE